MPFELEFAALDAGSKLGSWRLRLAQAQSQAFGRTAGLHEFTKWRLDHLEAGAGESRAQFPAHLIDENVGADVDSIAGEPHGVGFTDRDALRRRDPLFDQAVRIGVKGLGIVEQPTAL